MGFSPRYYQLDAVASPFPYWQNGGGHALIVIPTGGGKSFVLGMICKMLIEVGARVLVATHVQELVEQDYEAILRAWPDAPVGINSAALKRRDTRHDILVCSIQSVYKDVAALGPRHVLIIDEAQLVSRNASSMYGVLIAGMKATVPGMRSLGLTATPFRLDSGMLTDTYSKPLPNGEREDKPALFDDIIYEISIKQLIDDGFLCPLVSKATDMKIDVSGVAKRGGEFIAGQLEKAANVKHVNVGVVDELAEALKTRRMGLLAATGVQHAHDLAKLLQDRHGIEPYVLTGESPKEERKEAIRRAKAGDLRVLCGVNAIGVGLDIPHLDVLSIARPTASKGFHIQLMGRGTRCFGADITESIANGKSNCLVLDHAGNTYRHGPVDMIDGSKAGGDSKPPPMKECPQCKTIHFIGVRKCGECGHEFPFDPLKNVTSTAATAPLISSDKPPVWYYVDGMTARRHTKFGKPDSLRVDFLCGASMISKWVHLEHKGDAKGNDYVRKKAADWWRRFSRADKRGTELRVSTAPETVTEALNRLDELRIPGRILVQEVGKYPEIVDEDFAIPSTDPSVTRQY